MPDMWMDVDAAVIVPVNLLPLLDDTDFKTIEQAVVYNSTGLAVTWNFVTTAGAVTGTAVTPTTGGAYDWSEPLANVGMYAMEIPASGGASINNDTEGFGWISGVATGVLPWRGPVIGFRAAGLNNVLIDSAYSATRGLAGTALPDAAADAAGGLAISDAGGLDLDAQIKTDIDNIATKTGYLPSATAGDAGGVFIAGANAATSITTALTANITGNVTGNLSGSVGSVTGAVGSVTGAVGSVTGAVGSVTGAVGSVTAEVTANVAKISGDATAADNAEAFFDGTGYAGTNNVIPLVTVTTTATNLTNLPAAGATAAELAKVPKSDGVVTWNATALASINAEADTAISDAALATSTALGALVTTVGVAGAGLTAVPLHADWVNGGRLDLILDIIAADTTTDIPALIDALPTGAENADAVWDEALAGHAGAGSAGEALSAATAPSAATVADAVWDEAISGHLGAGTTGNALNAAGSAGDPWSTPIPGAYGAGTAGKILGDNVNAPIATVQTGVNDIPTVAEFEARTLPSADYVVVGDTLAGVTTTTNLTNLPAAAALEATLTAMKGATFSGATDSLEALRDRGDAAWITATGFATPTNITAGTITTVTNLTNAPTNGDLTATMKTSVTTAATAATPTAAAVTGAVGSVTGNVGGNVVGSVGTVNALAANVITAASVAADAVTEIQSGLATSAALAVVATDTTTDIPAQIAGLNNLSAAQVTAAVPTAVQNAAAVLAAATSNPIDANIQEVNDVALTGDGSATPWGPA